MKTSTQYVRGVCARILPASFRRRLAAYRWAALQLQMNVFGCICCRISRFTFISCLIVACVYGGHSDMFSCESHINYNIPSRFIVNFTRSYKQILEPRPENPNSTFFVLAICITQIELCMLCSHSHSLWLFNFFCVRSLLVVVAFWFFFGQASYHHRLIQRPGHSEMYLQRRKIKVWRQLPDFERRERERTFSCLARHSLPAHATHWT